VTSGQLRQETVLQEDRGSSLEADSFNLLIKWGYSSLNRCCSLNVRDQVPNKYKTTGQIVVSYILISSFYAANESKN
jgi:hypothetical protein